ncbi:MAG: shikimate dehydrogenase [Pelovirga sp.]
MNHLNGQTAVYGIFGDPVGHSLSPVMQNAAFAHCCIDAVYVPFHVRADHLDAAVSSLRALDIQGINVTIPHKESILSLLDEVDPDAARIGAVNTIINHGGHLVGYNTDSSGFLRSARDELGLSAEHQQVLILGAGGAARAAVHALLSTDIEQVTIANRSFERARQLSADFSRDGQKNRLAPVTYGTNQFLQALKGADLIVNTTSVGLRGEKLDFLLLENIKGSALIFDMVYSKAGTPLTEAAAERGLTWVDGLSLLAAQGEDAFFIWTGQRLAAGTMRCFLSEYLQSGNEMGKG